MKSVISNLLEKISNKKKGVHRKIKTKNTYETKNQKDFPELERWKMDIINAKDDIEKFAAKISDENIVFEDIIIKNCSEQMPLLVKEVLLCEHYNFYSAKDEKYICIDIGANVGLTSIYLLKNDLVNKVYTFEPMTPTFELMKKNFELNKKYTQGKVEVYNYGLDSENKTITSKFNMDHIISLSSEGTFNDCFDGTDIEIELKNASEILMPIVEHHKDNGEKIFLKIDCEGAEYKILPNLFSSGILQMIDVIILEFHNKPDALLEIFKRANFFYFLEYIRRDEYVFGNIKAVKIKEENI